MHIWTLAIEDEELLPSEVISSGRTLLSDEERSRAERFMFDRDRNRYIAAHALCRLMLSRLSLNPDSNYQPHEWLFGEEEKGRPYITNNDQPCGLDFNISHTIGMVGCAVSNSGRVGLDLEPKDRSVNLEALADKQFAKLEQQQFYAAPNAEKADSFFEFWTLKEAYIKVTGKGLTENLKGFGFDLKGEEPRCYLGSELLKGYQFGLFDVGDDSDARSRFSHQGAWAFQSNNGHDENNSAAPEYKQFDIESFGKLF